MKIFHLNDPIYHSRIVLIHDTTYEEIVSFTKKKYAAETSGLGVIKGFDGCCYAIKAPSGEIIYFIVFFRKLNFKRDSDLIVHEILHLALKILRRINLSLTEESEEAYCYFFQYLYIEVVRMLG